VIPPLEIWHAPYIARARAVDHDTDASPEEQMVVGLPRSDGGASASCGTSADTDPSERKRTHRRRGRLRAALKLGFQ
jgi:hypothetical protein